MRVVIDLSNPTEELTFNAGEQRAPIFARDSLGHPHTGGFVEVAPRVWLPSHRIALIQYVE